MVSGNNVKLWSCSCAIQNGAPVNYPSPSKTWVLNSNTQFIPLVCIKMCFVNLQDRELCCLLFWSIYICWAVFDFEGTCVWADEPHIQLQLWSMCSSLYNSWRWWKPWKLGHSTCRWARPLPKAICNSWLYFPALERLLWLQFHIRPCKWTILLGSATWLECFPWQQLWTWHYWGNSFTYSAIISTLHQLLCSIYCVINKLTMVYGHWCLSCFRSRCFPD